MHPPNEKTLAILLALIAGYVDACGFRVFGTFVSFMSGNTTQTGVLLGEQRFDAALLFVVAIAFFVAGSFAGTWLNDLAVRGSRQLLFTAVAVLLGTTIGIMHTRSMHSTASIAMLASAMGMINTAVSQVDSERVSLTFVTGDLSRIGKHLALALKSALVRADDSLKAHLGRTFLLSSVWLAFLTGAVLSGGAIAYLRQWMLLPPFLVILVLSLSSGAGRSGAMLRKSHLDVSRHNDS